MAAEERQSRRYEQLIEAAFTIMGSEGAAAVTMRGVCRTAKLTERYFYESFANREQMLIAVLDQVAHDAQDVLAQSLAQGPAEPEQLIRHVISRFTDYVTEDPRRGRVLWVESLAAPELATRGFELVEEFTSTIAQALRGPVLGGAELDEHDAALNAQAVFGALMFLFQQWLSGRLPVTRERFVEHMVRVVEQQMAVSSADSAS